MTEEVYKRVCEIYLEIKKLEEIIVRISDGDCCINIYYSNKYYEEAPPSIINIKGLKVKIENRISELKQEIENL